MTQVRVAVRAQDLGANHAMAGVGLFLKALCVNRAGEAGPAGSGVELVLRIEQGLPAAGAEVHAVFLAVPVVSLERGFGAFAAAHRELLGA